MTPQTATRATLDDLLKVEGKAELISGVIVPMSPAGSEPNLVAFYIAMSLHAYGMQAGGTTYTDGLGCVVPELSSGRETFGPDVAYYPWPRPPLRMKFVEGAPLFAVEVRSENDYGPKPERVMAEKRADYFEAGTLVVWDVDPVAKTVRAYSATDPATPRVFGAADTADAEPHLPGWRLPLEGVFA